MAKTNQVDLYGYVALDPVVKEDGSGARFVLNTKTADRESGLNQQGTINESIMIATKDQEQIEFIKTIRQFHIVRVKGVVTAKLGTRTVYCPKCGAEYTVDVVKVYVEPISMELVNDAFTTADEAAAFTFKHREYSNEARIMGNVCADPYQSLFKKNPLCSYQLAVPRTYRLAGSSDEERTDYLFVKSFRNNATDDLKRIRKGTLVLIDGFLHSRRIEKSCTCPKCGETMDVKTHALEIVPYETEYLRGYTTNEQLDGNTTQDTGFGGDEVM